MESRIDKLHFEYSKNSKPQIKNVSQIQILQNKAMRKKLDRLDKKAVKSMDDHTQFRFSIFSMLMMHGSWSMQWIFELATYWKSSKAERWFKKVKNFNWDLSGSGTLSYRSLFHLNHWLTIRNTNLMNLWSG